LFEGIFYLDSRYARWFALSIFAILIAGWVAAALHLTGASAGRPGFPFNLQSRLAADYGADSGDRISSLRISIISDFLRDLGFGDSESSVLSDLDSPVPTATARNFEGDPPFTPTVTPSPVPTETALPPETPTSTPKPLPSKTAEPSETKKPEATEKPGDSVAPTISGGSLFPSPGTMLPACNGNDIAITGLQVFDPAASSGIQWVKLKYKILGPGSQGYIYSGDIGPPVSGGWTDGPGSAWEAYYKGDLTIDFDVGYAFWSGGGKAYAGLLSGNKVFARPLYVVETATPMPSSTSAPTPTSVATATLPATATPIPTPFDVEVWSIVRDKAGNESYELQGSYTLSGTCGG
jgi:hypothetical protein